MSTELTKDDGYQKLVTRISDVYRNGRVRAEQAVNVHITETYWQIGHDIVEFEQGGKVRAEYGNALLASLSRDLTRLHGKGFSRSNLVRMRQLYIEFPIGAKPSHQLNFPEKVAGIFQMPSAESLATAELTKGSGYGTRSVPATLEAMQDYRGPRYV